MLELEAVEGRITAVRLSAETDEMARRPEARLASAIDQIQHYFDDPACAFDLPLNLRGTRFQRRVWMALREIPSGEIRSYGEIARRLGTAARAVGNACRRNPVPIIIPCHRVVSSSGVGGYAGAVGGRMLEIKRWLLAHEGVALGG
ncbi:MAG TPA: methylated-DNA--[protein]-cysteine S-methyltransferase [Chromatiales bacterium]|nr:methylated-DNA--[protein]-cysteine S-methyltransferase [Chromatiales bacterium]